MTRPVQEQVRVVGPHDVVFDWQNDPDLRDEVRSRRYLGACQVRVEGESCLDPGVALIEGPRLDPFIFCSFHYRDISIHPGHWRIVLSWDDQCWLERAMGHSKDA